MARREDHSYGDYRLEKGPCGTFIPSPMSHVPPIRLANHESNPVYIIVDLDAHRSAIEMPFL